MNMDHNSPCHHKCFNANNIYMKKYYTINAIRSILTYNGYPKAEKKTEVHMTKKLSLALLDTFQILPQNKLNAIRDKL